MKRFLPLALMMLLALPACAGQQQELSLSPLEVASPSGRISQLVVEVATTPDERRDGLMGRTSLAPDRGMLFVFPQPGMQAFWMKDTLIPLDMVFIRPDGTVAKVHDRAKPMDLTPITSGEPVIAVIELAGGRAKELGIGPGSVVSSPSLPVKSMN